MRRFSRGSDPRRKRWRTGFTLIELLIVVAIIGIIIAIILWLLKPPPCCPPPRVGSVGVYPGRVHAEPGTRFRLDVRVLSTTRNVIDVAQHAGLTMVWSSTPPGLVVTGTPHHAIVQVPNTPGASVQVQATVEWSFDGETDPRPGSPVVIAVNPTVADGDWVEVPYVGGARPIPVLITAGEGSSNTCVFNDSTFAVVQKAWLGRDLDDAGGCPPEFVAFGEDAEMVYHRAAYWKSGTDTRLVEPEPVFGWTDAAADAPNSYRYFDVVAGVPTGANNQVGDATDHMKFASALMDLTRVGIGLRGDAGVFVHGVSGAIDPAIACNESEVDNKMLAASPYQVADRNLFVLFVDDVLGATKGWACDPIEGKDGRVVYVALNEFEGSTIVHEIAHLLGLALPLMGGGHSNGIGNLREDNIMWGSRNWDLRKKRRRLSVGQLFRMNLDAPGWASTLAPFVTVPCQDEALEADPCPMLDEDLGPAGS